jgi:phage-related protein
MPVPISELQKANPSNIIELFELELNTVQHGATTVYRWHDGVNEFNNQTLVFGGNEYTRMPIQCEGFAYDGKQLPRPTLAISNIMGTITTLLLTLPQGLEGAKVTRIRTLERYIDNDNFGPDFITTEVSTTDAYILTEDDSYIYQEEKPNPHGTPDSSQKFPLEIFFIDRKKTENRENVIFELVASFDLQGVKVPKRQVLPADFPGVGSFYS